MSLLLLLHLISVRLGRVLSRYPESVAAIHGCDALVIATSRKSSQNLCLFGSPLGGRWEEIRVGSPYVTLAGPEPVLQTRLAMNL